MTTRQKFIFLYGAREGRKACREYRTIVDRYLRKRRKYEGKKRRPLSEKDIVLITYGDQFREKGAPPLQTLKKFLDRFLRGEGSSGFSVGPRCRLTAKGAKGLR